MKKIKYFRPDIKYFRPDIIYFRPDIKYFGPNIKYFRPDIKYFGPDIKYFRPDIKYFRLDTGKYTMLALNRTGEIWHSFNINVKGKKYKQLKGLFNNFYSAHNKTDFNHKWFNYCAALNIFL